MNTRNKIIYWIATLWLALGMTSTGLMQLMTVEEEIGYILQLGYPRYVLLLLGATKLAGVVVLLLPRLPVLKEWVYAGFCFTMTGALYSHFRCGHQVNEMMPAALLAALSVISWYFRPGDRRITQTKTMTT